MRLLYRLCVAWAILTLGSVAVAVLVVMIAWILWDAYSQYGWFGAVAAFALLSGLFAFMAAGVLRTMLPPEPESRR